MGETWGKHGDRRDVPESGTTENTFRLSPVYCLSPVYSAKFRNQFFHSFLSPDFPDFKAGLHIDTMDQISLNKMESASITHL